MRYGKTTGKEPVQKQLGRRKWNWLGYTP